MVGGPEVVKEDASLIGAEDPPETAEETKLTTGEIEELALGGLAQDLETSATAVEVVDVFRVVEQGQKDRDVARVERRAHLESLAQRLGRYLGRGEIQKLPLHRVEDLELFPVLVHETDLRRGVQEGQECRDVVRIQQRGCQRGRPSRISSVPA